MARLDIAGSYLITPQIHGDDRGAFLEWFRADPFAELTGHPLGLAQANCSVSRRGVIRGIHYADVPPGQAKYVTCVAGAVLDVIVDLRVGSPTFGRHAAVRLDDAERRAVYLAEGLGHGFCALSEQATVVYLCSTGYNPAAERGVHPLTDELGLPWREALAENGFHGEPVLSPKDSAAPDLARALADGTLPTWAACEARYAALTGAAATAVTTDHRSTGA